MARSLLQSLLAHFGRQDWWRDASRFEIIVGALLVQRTTWSNAERAVANLRDRGWLSIEALAAVGTAALESSIRPAGFYRTKAARLQALARYIAEHGGLASFDTMDTEALRRRFLSQPGIGPETADVILGFAFARAVFVVDAYARRLFERLDAPRALPSDTQLKNTVQASLLEVEELNELHALIVAHGRHHCRTEPRCEACPLLRRCGFPALRHDSGGLVSVAGSGS